METGLAERTLEGREGNRADCTPNRESPAVAVRAGSERLRMGLRRGRSRKVFGIVDDMASPLPDPVPLHLVRRALVTKLRHHGDVSSTSP